MRTLLFTYGTAAITIAATAFISTSPAQAMTMAIPAGLSAAVQDATIKQDVQCGCGGYAYYAPSAYAYAYAPYAYGYGYAPSAYAYYRPYAYGAYAYRGYGPRIWAGWGRRGWW
jgi:hypothetical protein